MVKKIVWAFILLLVAGAAGVIYMGAGAAAPGETYTVMPGTISRGVRGSGKIEGKSEPQLIKAIRPGMLEKVNFKEGDEVPENEHLGALSTVEIDVKIGEQEAIVKQRTAEMELAKADSSPDAIQKAEEKLKESIEGVKIAESELSALKEPEPLQAATPAQLEDAKRAIEIAKFKLVLTESEVKRLQPTADQLAVSELEVGKARTAVDNAEQVQVAYKKPGPNIIGPTSPDRTAELTANIENAKKDLQLAEAKRDQLRRGPRAEDVASAQAKVELAKLELQGAEGALKRLQNPEAPSATAPHKVKQAEIALVQAQLRVKQSESDLKLAKRGPKPETIAIAEAAKQQAEEVLKGLKLQREGLILRAPFSGMVFKRYVEAGSIVNAMEPIFSMIDFSEKKVRAEFDVARMKDLQEGMTVTVTSRAFKEELTGKLEKIGNVSARTLFSEDKTEPQGGQVVQTIVLIEAPKGELKKEIYNKTLRPGLRVDVEVTLERRENVISIPKTYVSTQPDGQECVWKLDRNAQSGANEAPKVQFVKCGLRDEHFVEILSGLASGDQIAKPKSVSGK
jgi:multidrug efflux pump subunit AcrA (membrane-fusion protein)